LDVFVIGANAQEQLTRFFELNSKIFDNQRQELLKLTKTMEMHELGTANANQNGNNFNVIGIQQQQQMSLNQAQHHIYNNGRNCQPPRFIGEQNHRELPVDVPDSFVGYAKESPRYPPTKKAIPKPQVNNNSTAYSNQQHHHQTVNVSNPVPLSNMNGAPKNSRQQAGPPISQSTAANIMTHNSSLRSSIKLKQLEKSRAVGGHPTGQMQPAINQAFLMDEDDIIPNANGQQPCSTLKQQQQQKVLNMKQSMPDLCSIYNRLQVNLNGDFIEDQDDGKLMKLLSIYNTIVRTHDKQFRIPNLTSRQATKINPQTGAVDPVVYKLSGLLQSVRSILRQEEDKLTSDVIELLAILCKHEIDAVCSAFDRISQSFEHIKSTRPESPTDENDQHITPNQAINVDGGPAECINNYQYHQMVHGRHDEYPADQIPLDTIYQQNNLLPLTDIDLNEDACTKIVSIEQNPNQPLGATIRNEEGSVVISRIICGGAAHKSRLLNEGDELLEVNGRPLRGKTVNEVVDILQGIQGTITFQILPRNYQPIIRPPQEKIFVRTFFKYDGENDRYIPCKELGLSFNRGEILTIIDQSDPRWWQAHREGDSEWRLAGLIPSIGFLKEREKETNQEDAMANVYFKREKKNLVSMLFNCPKAGSPRRRKKLASLSFGPEEIPYYEEVSLYYPDKYRKRPIILVGPKNIGQGDIVANLLRDTSRFARVVSHTSKPISANERDGVTFHFVSRAQFEADIKAGKFIECGQYQNQYYGTSLEAIRDVIRSRKTCVHLVNTPSILKIRQGPAGCELKPFFVFVRPDDSHPDKLRNLVETYSPPKSNIEENVKSILAEVELIDAHYLPYFDLVLTVSDIDRASENLLAEIEKIEKEPQWIPMFWQDRRPSN